MPRPRAIAPDPISYAPLGMSAGEAARYLGIGETLFLELVSEGRMPRARLINRRRVWDSRELAAAFAALPHEGEREGNVIDALFQNKGKHR